MARVTVEDCEEVVPNRFNLVVLANQRVKQYKKGAKLTIAEDNDKETVLALREIACNTLNIDELKDATIKELQNYAFEEDDDDEYLEEDTYDPSMTVDNQPSLKTSSSLDTDQVDDDSVIDFSCIIQDEENEDSIDNGK